MTDLRETPAPTRGRRAAFVLPTLRALRDRPAQTIPLGLAFVAMVASGPGQSFLVAVFVDEMLAGTQLSRTAFSLLYAAGTVVSALAMLGLGRLSDRFGLRALWVVASGGLAGACFLAGGAQGLFTVFLALALLRTFGQGSLPLVASLLVAGAFRGRRGQAMASASLGLTVAGVALPPLAVMLILELGWRDAYRVLGLALLLLVVPLAAVVRAPRRGEPDGRDAPGAVPARRYPRALRRRRGVPRVDVPTRRARRLLFVLAAPPLLMTAVIFHAVSLLDERGVSLSGAAVALSLFGAANAIATIATGVVSDRTTTRRLLVVITVLLVAAELALLAPNDVTAYLGFVLLGLSGGVFVVVAGIVWPRTYGLADLGRLQGTAWSVQIAGAALGPLPLAVSRALTGAYEPALAVLAAYAVGALVVAARWRDPRAIRLATVGS